MTNNHAYHALKESTPFRTLPFYLLPLGLGLLIWQIGVLWISDTPRRFLLPTPLEVSQRFIHLLNDGTLFYHTRVTLKEMGLGLCLGTTTALLLGYAVAHSRILAYILEPVIITSQAVPIIALAPLLTVWFGPGLTSKVFVCALIVFFPILINVVTGLQSIETRYHNLFRLLEASHWQILLQLEVPAAMPAFLAGLKVGGTLAGMGAVVGEFVASSEGLGYLVKQGQNLYDLPLMFVAISALMIIALCIYGALTLIERRLLKWHTLNITIS